MMKLNIRRKLKRRLPARIKEPLATPEQMNSSWSMDFMSDALVSGGKLECLISLTILTVKL